VILPAELEAFPVLPQDHGWRNPVVGYDYDRGTWELYCVRPAGSITLAVIRRDDAGAFAVWRDVGLGVPEVAGVDAVAAFRCAASHWGGVS